MSYDWTQLGVREITNLYLYGMPNTPEDLLSESRIRSKEETLSIDVNRDSFMATGPGRFALGSQSALVEAFFSSTTDLSCVGRAGIPCPTASGPKPPSRRA
jgi:hypothetical protein